MRRAADEIDNTVAQRRIGLVDWEDELKRNVEPFGLEEAKLDRGLRREIGVRNHGRHGELHLIRPRGAKRSGGGGPPEAREASAGWWRGHAALRVASPPTPLPPRFARSPFPASRGRKISLLPIQQPAEFFL